VKHGKRRPLRYKWWRRRDGFDLILMGEPDAHVYIIRYWNETYKSAAWCWSLTMPRGSVGETANGWASNPHDAKRQAEDYIQEHWK